MIKATKIKMCSGCQHSDNLLEIDKIYLMGVNEDGYYSKAAVHDFIKDGTNSVCVDIAPYPKLQAVVSGNGEKYVRSESNSTTKDNLLKLPRE